MRHLILSCLFVQLFAGASGQSFASLPDSKKPCWQYLNLTDSFPATIISYFPNNILSGKFPSASIAIVKLSNGDTIRLVCNRIEGIRNGNLINAHPFKHIDVKNTILPADEGALTCRIPKTVDASITRRYLD